MAAQGTWTTTANAPGFGGNPASLETAILLTDGTVIVHDYGAYTSPSIYTTWYKLTPDSKGNYADGTWTTIASTNHGTLYGQTAVLQDGRFFYGGGEYLSGTTDHNKCEVYDPLTNTWTNGPDSLWPSLGDTGSAILPDGLLLCSDWTDTNTDIYNETTNSWENASPMFEDTGDEETWNSLPDGSILNTYFIGQRY